MSIWRLGLIKKWEHGDKNVYTYQSHDQAPTVVFFMDGYEEFYVQLILPLIFIGDVWNQALQWNRSFAFRLSYSFTTTLQYSTSISADSAFCSNLFVSCSFYLQSWTRPWDTWTPSLGALTHSHLKGSNPLFSRTMVSDECAVVIETQITLSP